MTCFSLLSYHGFINHKSNPNSHSSFSSPLHFSTSFKYYSLHGFCCKNQIKPLLSSSSNNKPLHVQNRKNNFSLRLRPRLRLLSRRLKRIPIRLTLDDVTTFMRNNAKTLKVSTFVSVILALCYFFLRSTSLPSPKFVPYSDLITSLEKGSVSKVLLEEGSRRIYYNTISHNGGDYVKTMEEYESLSSEVSIDNVLDKDIEATSQVKGKRVIKKIVASRDSTPVWEFSVRKIDHDEKFLLKLMREKGTVYSSAPQSMIASIRSLMITILTLWIPLTPLMWILYRQLSTGNNTAKKRKPNTMTVSFADVEGVDAAKVELLEIVLCMQGAINYKKLGAKLPGGVLLVGPPGTGKTLLARAVAGEAGVPFFSVSASEFVELFVGRGAARIRDLFSVARKQAPSIIFIDELDAVGGKRGKSFNDERDQTLNQLLTEMDGFEKDNKVVVIAATNRPEALDPALCRPGRFSRKVVVGEPDEEGRRKIMAVHLRDIPLEEDPHLICDLVASLTPSFVGADLANIVNEAALLAARRGSETVAREDIMEAIERAKFGINDSRPSPDKISKEIRRLFPWMTSILRKNEMRVNGMEGPLGYQSLS